MPDAACKTTQPDLENLEPSQCQLPEATAEQIRFAQNQQTYGGVQFPLAGKEMGKEKNDFNPELLVDPPDNPALDVVRIFCVWLACVDHAGTKFGKWNYMYVQSWVLQYLFMVCGICYSLSTRPLLSYLKRLALYFCIGVIFNLVAWMIAGLDWKHNMWGVVFQFWFIFGLMIFTTLLTPIKKYLRQIRQQADATGAATWTFTPPPGEVIAYLKLGLGQLFIIISGAACVIIVFMYVFIPMLQLSLAPLVNSLCSKMGSSGEFWGMPSDPSETKDFIHDFFGCWGLTISSVFIVVAWPLISSRISLIGWLVIANMYAHRLFMYRNQDSRMVNGFDFTMLGLVCCECGLSHRRIVGEYMLRYWFVFLFVCGILWPPGTQSRMDEHPPRQLNVRFTYNLLEMLFTMLFLCAMERMIDPKIFRKDRMQFFGNFALALFLVHKAVYILVPRPYCWIVIFSLVPICYVCTGQSTTPKPAAQEALESATDPQNSKERDGERC